MANIELDGVNKKIKVDSGDLTLDVPGDIVLDADGGDVVFADGGTNLLKVTNSSSDVVLQPQVDTKDIVFKQYDGTVVATVEDNATFNIPTDKLAINGTAVTSTAAELNILDGVTSTAAELNIMDGVTSTTAELNILDGVTSTAAELNIVDGNTSATSTTLADADRVVVNDAGTMKQVAMTDVKTYMGGGGLVPISTIALSAAAQVNMNSVFSDTYLNYFLVLSMIKVAGDNSLDIQFGTGGSYDGGNHYGWTNHFMINNGTNGASVSDSATSNKIRLIPDIDADSEAGASGQFIITNPKGGYQRKHISGTAAVQKTTAGNTAIVNSAGTFHESSTQNFTDIRFLTGNGGNFTAGSTSGGYGMIQLFGIVNS